MILIDGDTSELVKVLLRQDELMPKPADWYAWPLQALRRRAVDVLDAPLQAVVTTAWASELPAGTEKQVRRAVHAALVTSVEDLSISGTSAKMGLLLHYWLWHLPPYWEPAEAEGIGELPKAQRQAYRWAAALVGYAVRNRLEELHSRYTSDDSMPNLNRGVRNQALQLMLQDPLTGHLLTRTLALLTGLAEQQGPDYLPLPPVAGA